MENPQRLLHRHSKRRMVNRQAADDDGRTQERAKSPNNVNIGYGEIFRVVVGAVVSEEKSSTFGQGPVMYPASA